MSYGAREATMISCFRDLTRRNCRSLSGSSSRTMLRASLAKGGIRPACSCVNASCKTSSHCY